MRVELGEFAEVELQLGVLQNDLSRIEDKKMRLEDEKASLDTLIRILDDERVLIMADLATLRSTLMNEKLRDAIHKTSRVFQYLLVVSEYKYEDMKETEKGKECIHMMYQLKMARSEEDILKRVELILKLRRRKQ